MSVTPPPLPERLVVPRPVGIEHRHAELNQPIALVAGVVGSVAAQRAVLPQIPATPEARLGCREPGGPARASLLSHLGGPPEEVEKGHGSTLCNGAGWSRPLLSSSTSARCAARSSLRGSLIPSSARRAYGASSLSARSRRSYSASGVTRDRPPPQPQLQWTVTAALSTETRSRRPP